MKVSVIIPVYNVASYIEACIESVFKQTYRNIEIIFVDDCGTDNSMDTIKQSTTRYAESHHIKILHHSKNKGLSAARNTGINHATGDYLLFLDSDDTLPPDALENLVAEANKYPNVSFVIGNIRQTTGKRQSVHSMNLPNYIDAPRQILYDFLSHKWHSMAWNKLISKEFLTANNICFWEGKYHEDIDFSFKLALYANSMAYCPKPTYNYLIRQNSITTNKCLKNYEDYIHILQNNCNILMHKNIPLQYTETYLTEHLYSLCYNIAKEKNPAISLADKKTLLSRIKTLKSKYAQRYHHIHTVKSRLISLPVPILFILFKLYILTIAKR